MTYNLWAQRHPQAARELEDMLAVVQTDESSNDSNEAQVQQQQRFQAAQAGALLWRNNVGATPAKCQNCNAKQRPVRYGLCNDSPAINSRIKSADLVGLRPVIITSEMVGTTIGQFVSVESKKQNWKFTGKGREAGQAAWAALILSKGGFATISNKELEL